MLSRYFYLLAVILCPWVGAGNVLILERVRPLRFGKVWVAAVVAAFVVVPALGFDKHFKQYKVLRELAEGGRYAIVYGSGDVMDKTGFPSPGS